MEANYERGRRLIRQRETERVFEYDEGGARCGGFGGRVGRVK